MQISAELARPRRLLARPLRAQALLQVRDIKRSQGRMSGVPRQALRDGQSWVRDSMSYL